mmetsp:Transcript_100317/g.284179  ORF Transcript_100317/g.284179 Transcript_100317/m.284179 type:complete len:255 (+) Transcript_100317:82-846(+)
MRPNEESVPRLARTIGSSVLILCFPCTWGLHGGYGLHISQMWVGTSGQRYLAGQSRWGAGGPAGSVNETGAGHQKALGGTPGSANETPVPPRPANETPVPPGPANETRERRELPQGDGGGAGGSVARQNSSSAEKRPPFFTTTPREPGDCSVPGEDCQYSMCCQDPAMTCYRKHREGYGWAGCKRSCSKGIDVRDPENHRQVWECDTLPDGWVPLDGGPYADWSPPTTVTITITMPPAAKRVDRWRGPDLVPSA